MKRNLLQNSIPLSITECVQNFSEESIRFRFFQIIKDTPHDVRVRYCNIDYDREIAIVAELNEEGRRKILGVVRVSLEPDLKKGEIAFIVADQWQGLGLGTKMMDHVIDICKDMKVETLYAIMLPDNVRAISMTRKMGFAIKYLNDGTVRGNLDLKEEEGIIKPKEPEAGKEKEAEEQAQAQAQAELAQKEARNHEPVALGQ